MVISLPKIPYIHRIFFRIGQNHTSTGIYGVHGIFSREITIHTVIYGADIRFWPTLLMQLVSDLTTSAALFFIKLTIQQTVHTCL